MSFVQRPGKFNFKKLSDVKSSPIMNLMYQGDFSKATKMFQSMSLIDNIEDFKYNISGFLPGVVFGKPNSVLRECENSPGVWVFDFNNGVTIYMFSDGFRKNHYKGTSIEADLSGVPLNDVVLTEALNELWTEFKIKVDQI